MKQSIKLIWPLKIFSVLGLFMLAACGDPSNTSEKTSSPSSDGHEIAHITSPINTAEVPDALRSKRRQRVTEMAASYSNQVHYRDSFNALDPRISRASVARGNSFNPNDDYWGLPRTTGYEEVAINCAGCHSLAIVMQQRVTKSRWAELLKWMVEKQGMLPMESPDNELVKAYLNEHFSSD